MDYMALEAEIMALLAGREASVWNVQQAAWGYWSTLAAAGEWF